MPGPGEHWGNITETQGNRFVYLGKGSPGLGQPPGGAFNLAWGPGVLRQGEPQGCSGICLEFLQAVWGRGGRNETVEQGLASEHGFHCMGGGSP